MIDTIAFFLSGGSGFPIARTVNFAIFAAIMAYLLYKPIMQGLQSRAQTIQDDLNRAQREREAAEAKMRELDEKFAKLESEVAAIRAQAQRDAETERERILQAAREDADRLRTLARMEIEGAAKNAQRQLKAFTAAQAVELAENLIRREMNDADQGRLVSGYVDHLERIN